MEIGHYYEKDIAQGEEYIARSLARYVPLIPVLSADTRRGEDGETVHVHMIDDYHSQNILTPAQTIKRVLAAAAMNDIRIDYIAREGAFVDYAQDVYDLLRPVISQTDPDPRATTLMHTEYRREGSQGYQYAYGKESYLEGLRMTPEEKHDRGIGGWVKNDIEIFSVIPPKKRVKQEHFLHLPDGTKHKVSWSCPWLATIFQAHRLDMIPEITTSGLEPVFMDKTDFKDERKPWDEYPGIIKIEEDAPPYQAERINSILDKDYLAVEATVTSFLAAIDPQVTERRGLTLL